MLLKLGQHNFNDSGLSDEQEMLGFAEVWPGAMSGRNAAAHQVTGDTVVLIVDHRQGNLRRVLQRAFRSLWRISPSDWNNATEAQRASKLRNCSDHELDPLG
ncbi:unnamed protein product [Tuber aestivum]|uniref:Uncharacterized protein n=1 Tax=Tuber aestivum TaxID=59557 RepID=A0A292Q0N1_9PEZI|nr:unnamed protein product [Tuber aestivum]